MDRTRARARRLRSNPTDAEMKLWQFLRRRQLAGFRFRRQVPLAGFIADFACLEKNLIVELDGGQHAVRAGYDAQRTEALEVLGYRVLRYWNDAVLKQMPEVLEDILRALEER
ncbi:hypothetical protein D3C81_744170 [compost metagenome]